jgi:ribonuclease Z
MALATDILDNLRGFSKAMYSTWVFYRPAHALFDAGEGVATSLGNFVYAVERVFLSHGHYDHIGGITGFVLARAGAMGEKTKPLDIYYPAGDGLIEMARDYVGRIARNLPFECRWHATEPETVIPVTAGKGTWNIRAFPTKHVRGMRTLGFSLEETRRRLKPELQGTPGPELAKLRRANGSDSITESYAQRLLTYSGDAMPIDPQGGRGGVLPVVSRLHPLPPQGDRAGHSGGGGGVGLRIPGPPAPPQPPGGAHRAGSRDAGAGLAQEVAHG